MTISVTSFRGCNRFSPLLIHACLIFFESCWSVSSFTLNVNCPPLFCIVVACFSIKNWTELRLLWREMISDATETKTLTFRRLEGTPTSLLLGWDEADRRWSFLPMERNNGYPILGPKNTQFNMEEIRRNQLIYIYIYTMIPDELQEGSMVQRFLKKWTLRKKGHWGKWRTDVIGRCGCFQK